MSSFLLFFSASAPYIRKRQNTKTKKGKEEITKKQRGNQIGEKKKKHMDIQKLITQEFN